MRERADARKAAELRLHFKAGEFHATLWKVKICALKLF
jgi:hypothetical protein